jgi:hypothetical protein
VPPLLVTWFSLQVLSGFASPETWRVPVLVLLGVQLLAGLGGTGGFVVGDSEQAALIRRSRRGHREERRAQRRQRRQPHNQPHKPDVTRPNEAQQNGPGDAQDRTEPDQTEPGATAERHS